VRKANAERRGMPMTKNIPVYKWRIWAAYEGRFKALQEVSVNDRAPFGQLAKHHKMYFVGLMSKKDMLARAWYNRGSESVEMVKQESDMWSSQVIYRRW